MKLFRTPTRFSILNKIFYFFPHIAESAQYRQIFLAKTFGDIESPLYFDFKYDKHLKNHVYSFDFQDFF